MTIKKLLSNLSEEDLKELFIIDMFRTYELNKLFLDDLDGATNRRKILQLKSFIEEQMENIKLDLAETMISNGLDEVEFFEHRIKLDKNDKNDKRNNNDATVSFERILCETDENLEKEIQEEEEKYTVWETNIKNNILEAVNNHYNYNDQGTCANMDYTFLQLCEELPEDVWKNDTTKFDILNKLQDLVYNGLLTVDGDIYTNKEFNQNDGSKILDYSNADESNINQNFIIKKIN
ncbi:hypothetical protein [Methanococcus voltae]|uniref:Uncharacterized protein n=1 Tax=Methanococcus voltae (strain ATCC BAA-1334 / A3) TaxID=456320 RepID=D7DT30_METV3|nr:hypothetical protein [Methanococcus voltae]MCS3901934.1 hypothetical protein [Methanococcus voltae]